MTTNAIAAARKRAYELPLDQINVSDIELYRDDTIWPYFERLRREDPVHYCANSKYGPFWSITKYKDIMSVDTNHRAFSSAYGVTLLTSDSVPTGGFISMDPPRHDEQRKTVSPIVAPGKPGQARTHDSSPGLRDTGLSANWGDLQLGRKSFD